MKPSELKLRAEVEADLYEAACECTNALSSRNAYDEEVAALRQTLLALVELGVRIALGYVFDSGVDVVADETVADILQARPGAEGE